MIEHIPLALSSLKAAKEIITTIQDLRDFGKIFTATSELKERLIESIDGVLATKEQLLSFQNRITDLEKENNHLKDWTAEKKQWSLRQVGHGNFAYVRNDFMGNLQQAQKLCCNCFDKTIRSTLQERKIPVGMKVSLVCSNHCPELIFDCYINEV